MTDQWISTKRWTCKYCDITINDDAPSRNQHENGFRHIGNKERALRAIYKRGHDKQKAEADERREMERIELAAAIAHARDTGAPVPSSLARPKPAGSAKRTGGGYTTAADLGVGLDAAAGSVGKNGRDETVGVAGEWEAVVPVPSLPRAPPSSVGAASAADAPAQPGASRAGEQPPKRGPPPPPPTSELDEARAFKVKRTERAADLGLDDDDLPAIRLRSDAPAASAAAAAVRGLKREAEEPDQGGRGFQSVRFGDRLPENHPPANASTSSSAGAGAPPAVAAVKPDPDAAVPPAVKAEPAEEAAAPPAGGLFKKRRGAPKGAGKRPAV